MQYQRYASLFRCWMKFFLRCIGGRVESREIQGQYGVKIYRQGGEKATALIKAELIDQLIEIFNNKW